MFLPKRHIVEEESSYNQHSSTSRDDEHAHEQTILRKWFTCCCPCCCCNDCVGKERDQENQNRTNEEKLYAETGVKSKEILRPLLVYPEETDQSSIDHAQRVREMRQYYFVDGDGTSSVASNTTNGSESSRVTPWWAQKQKRWDRFGMTFFEKVDEEVTIIG